MTIILFIAVLALLIFVHELGHFLAAKAVGARVDEFGLGFPPRLLSFKIGETIYSLNLLPFGGFVKIYGESLEEDETREMEDKERNLSQKARWQQAVVLSAGVFFNIILTWILLSAGFMSGLSMSATLAGDRYELENISLTVIAVSEGSPAALVGLMPGDKIVGMRKGQEVEPFSSIESFQEFVRATEAPFDLIYGRDGQEATVSITAVPGVADSSEPAIGVALDMVGQVDLSPLPALWNGLIFTAKMFQEMVGGFWFLGREIFSGRQELSEAVAGPVGIAGMVGDARALGFVYLMTFTAFISLNLAVINLMPFPALDGGRLLFLLIEKIKGSPIRPKLANTMNLVGFALLIVLMIVITVGDIARLF